MRKNIRRCGSSGAGGFKKIRSLIFLKSFNGIYKRVEKLSHPFFILLFLLLPGFHADASFRFTKNTEKAYEEFLKLKVSSGSQYLDIARKENPSDGIPDYLENYLDIILILLSDNERLYKDKLNASESRLKKISRMDNKSPYYLFCQAEIKIQWAFVRLRFGEEFTAMWELRQAYKMLEENKRKFPDFIPQKKSLGMLNILIGSIPDKYTWVTNLAGMKGNITEGLRLLDEVIISGNIFSKEAALLKLIAENYILSKDHKDTGAMERFYKANPDNLLMCFLYASMLLKESEGEKALALLRDRPAAGYPPFPYLDLMTGDAFMQKGLYKKARFYYASFINSCQGKNFIKDAYYKLFLSYWLYNEDTTAMPYLDKVISFGQARFDSDKYADAFARRKDFPDRLIMKARLYTDGGYYPEALDALRCFRDQLSSVTKDNIEYYYRLGRLFHKTGDLPAALDNYLKTIEQSGQSNYYFAPNACLQCGYIYRTKNEKDKAIFYFEKAMSYKNHEYKNSIDTKAKAAINELKTK